MTAKAAPKLIYVVAEDWFFVSHRLDLACAARDAGFDVIVATRVGEAGKAILERGLRLAPVPFLRSGLNPLADMATLRALKSLYAAERPDIVHHVAMKPVIYGSLAARATGVPGIVNAMSGLGFVFSSGSLKAKVLRPLVRGLLRLALSSPSGRVIVQNGDDRAFLLAQGVVPPEALRLVRGSGVDPARYELGDPVGTGVPLVVLPARMLRDKGVVEFIEAARTLKSEGIQARLALCGAPDPVNPASLSEAGLLALAKEGIIEYWGWQPDMTKVWSEAQIACLPSYREGLPRALLEAAASGLPLVATDVPGCREICRAGENGWLVPAQDGRALADALREAITRADLRAAYGRRSRALIETELSLASVVKETLSIYRELLIKHQREGRVV